MEIIYDNKMVKTLFDDWNLMARKKGSEFSRAVKKRYDQLKAAETFADYLKTGLGKPKPLSENKAGLYSVRITANKRLIVQPDIDDLSLEGLKKCTKVIIKGAEDYHGTKVTTYIP